MGRKRFAQISSDVPEPDLDATLKFTGMTGCP